jgi:hypothetical protein
VQSLHRSQLLLEFVQLHGAPFYSEDQLQQWLKQQSGFFGEGLFPVEAEESGAEHFLNDEQALAAKLEVGDDVAFPNHAFDYQMDCVDVSDVADESVALQDVEEGQTADSHVAALSVAPPLSVVHEHHVFLLQNSEIELSPKAFFLRSHRLLHFSAALV